MTSANQNGAHQDADFKNKWSEIENNYGCFWSQPNAVADVEAYLRKYQHHQYDQAPQKWVKERSQFQWDNLNPTEILAKNDYAVILGNRSSFDASQYPGAPGQASMSFIHVLGLSNKQIFNGVSLTQHNCVIIDQIIQLFESYWEDPNSGYKFRDEVIDYQRKMFKSQEARIRAQKPHDRAPNPAEYLDRLSKEALDLKAEDFNYGLHLWPEQSVGHLHIHIVARPWNMRKYSTLDHDAKTVDARDVREFIMKKGPKYYGPPYEKYEKAKQASNRSNRQAS
ncbi:hypothetical protein KJ359_012126 [Pestalotiopsis sp. 9143b]|nr:hypothetical protein KJ359_012126 [Pestalotiopsis sp. 9143b]